MRMSFLPREHQIHIFEASFNVLFIMWIPDVVEIADFYFIVFEKSSKFYKSPFVFTESNRKYKALVQEPVSRKPRNLFGSAKPF